MPQAKTVGERIAQARREKAAREHRDIAAGEVAEAVGVTPANYSRWESDERVPREDALAKLAAYLDVTPAYLRYGVSPNRAPDLPEILQGARKLTQAEIDRANAITARAARSEEKPKKRRANGKSA